MRKILLFTLVTLMATAVAQAQVSYHEPTFDSQYNCDFSSPSGNEVDPGWSIFTNRRQVQDQEGRPILYGIEVYKATTSTGQDNRRVAFAKPANHCPNFDPPCQDPASVPNWTTWEYTTDILKCTALVSQWGKKISFFACTNGKTRTCTRVW